MINVHTEKKGLLSITHVDLNSVQHQRRKKRSDSFRQGRLGGALGNSHCDVII